MLIIKGGKKKMRKQTQVAKVERKKQKVDTGGKGGRGWKTKTSFFRIKKKYILEKR